MVFYYFMLTLGTLFFLFALYAFIGMFRYKDFPLLDVGKAFGALLIGVLLLVMTLPSLKSILLKEYDVISGECVIEIDSSSRSATADFTMLDTDEIYSFNDIPKLDAYGKAIPYYCELTVTKNHMFEIGYKIYDVKTRKLITASE